MGDEWKKVWLVLSIAFTAGIARSISSGERRSFGQFVQGLFIAGFVGALAALALSTMPYSEPFKGFLIGLAAFAGEDVLLGVLNLSRTIAKNPERYLGKYFGRKR
jgi:hypothetical protein